MITLAKEKGFDLTAEDLNQKAPSGELSDDELDAVAGGKACGCALGGGGEISGKHEYGHIIDDVCACVGFGMGTGWKHNPDTGMYYQVARCACPLAGGGTSLDG